MPNHEIKQASDGQWYFTVLGANGEIVATSELYSTKSNAERGYTDLYNVVTKSQGSDNNGD